MKKRYLILEDGTIFQGWAFGADCAAIGELVFHTGVVGYVENLTDPCYYGQIVMQTYPMVGNYGMMEEDFMGKPALSGYVVKEYCERPSNFRCQYDLDTFLKQNNIPGLCGVDTRELTNRIREYGVLNAMLTDQIPEDFEEISAYTIRDAVAHTTAKEPRVYEAEGEQQFHVAVLDCGAALQTIRFLTARGCKVTAVPAGTAADEILALNPDGIALSGGPGSPADCPELVEKIRQLAGKKPMLAIGLGHQLLALAMGGKTVKLKYGHRGTNQPCRKLGTERTWITSQNHGYTVQAQTVPGAVESFVNLNDNTNEGLEYPELCAMSVQFDPESCNGFLQSNVLFEQFAAMMKEGVNHAAE